MYFNYSYIQMSQVFMNVLYSVLPLQLNVWLPIYFSLLEGDKLEF